ncbi:MAG: GDSL-type esterase/lipase family protein [Egibacteraceae bacterium]
MVRRRSRCRGRGGVIVFLVAALSAVGLPARAAPPPLPDSMAALGDSITRGFNACGFFVDCPPVSWSTGRSGLVNSHYLRILAQNSEILGQAFNDARTGAKVADLERQAEFAVDQRVEYVTILIGTNDACTRTQDAMTPVGEFESQLRAGMRTLRTGLPEAAILVASIPDVKRLWRIGKDDPAARVAWAALGVCQSMMARPLSTAPEDEARRDRVRRRIIDYNDLLREVCRDVPPCRFDDNAVFKYPFELEQVSTWDYFHPSGSGQQILAELTYRETFDWLRDG